MHNRGLSKAKARRRGPEAARQGRALSPKRNRSRSRSPSPSPNRSRSRS
ncbi:unnamed protein product, partial [Gulo gulo]